VLEWVDQIVGEISTNPWLALLVGLGIGIVIGAAVTAAGRPWR